MTQIGIPLYKYPTGAQNDPWGYLRKFSNNGRFVGAAVVNPDSGPGKTTDPVWNETIKRNTRANLRSLCYVDCDYSKQGPLYPTQQGLIWGELYGNIPGYFLDDFPTDPDDGIDIILQFRQRVPTKTLAINPGLPITTSDILRQVSYVVAYEGNYAGFVAQRENISAELWKKAWILVHGATQLECFDVWNYCSYRGAKFVWVSDIPFEYNPWNQLGNLFLENLVA